MAEANASTFQPAAVAVAVGEFVLWPVFTAIGVAVAVGSLKLAPVAEALTDRGINRILTGREAVVLDAPPRGTYGLMPAEWGVVQDFDLDDAAPEWSLRYADGRLLARGQSSEGTLTISMTLRMPASAVLPERGQTFMHEWRGVPRQFVVWAVSPVYRIRSVRLVDVTAIHELDLGNRTPVASPQHIFTLTLL
jgi:hypothetical protein